MEQRELPLFGSIDLNSKIAIFSTTKLAVLLRHFIEKYRKDLSVICFIDSYKHSQVVDGLNVYHPCNIPPEVDLVIIGSKANKQVLASVLEENNCKNYVTVNDALLELLEFNPYDEYLSFVPPGHYYSPIPSKEDVKKALLNKKFDVDNDCAIDYKIKRQLEMVDYLSMIKDKYTFYEEKYLDHYFYTNNDMFSGSDALSLIGIILKNNTKRVIEVGSGFSTAFLYDLNRFCCNNEMKISSIEPYPERLVKLFGEDYEALDLQVTNLQDVPLSFFDSLEENDLLFIDSSHVVKANSDVHYLMFEILPRLKKGVIIHFHDILFPYEYPEYWFVEQRHWNEIYFLRAFLAYNKGFEIEFFGQYMHEYIRQKNIKQEFHAPTLGNSLFIRKVV